MVESARKFAPPQTTNGRPVGKPPPTSGPPPVARRPMRQRLVVARPAWRGWRVVGPPLLLCGCAALFVGSDVVERHLFPDLTTGWRHFLLTARSAVVTGMGSAIVYLIMRRQQNQLTTTARQLSQLLETYRANPHTRVHFDNPHLVHCRDVFSCQRVACPAHSAPTARCWQVAALSSHARDGDGPVVTIQQCHECEVYRLSCPDGMTQLGESLNNLMFLLDEEAQQLRRIQGQMVEREKLAAIGQMAAGIAHEIGNPLSSISAIVQVLKRRHPDASQAEQFDLIQAHIQRISSTVRQLSGLARPSPERWEPVDLLSTLQESVRLVGFDRRAKDTRIVFAPPASLPRTWALRAQLQQVFINILLNALDAMESGGELTVRVEGRPRSIAFVFEDTGCGIPAAIGRRVFEPFYSTKEPGRGTGLGLAVSYAIVRKHGGTIEFAPRNGGGTVFRVELPILSESPDE